MQLIENLKWRYATKKFNPERKVSQSDLSRIKEAVKLSASSYGLQLYKVLIVEDPDLREKLKPAAWNQSQITDASHLFVFCNYTSGLPELIDNYLELKAETQDLELESIKGYGEFIKGKLRERSAEEIGAWTAKQVYLALGNLLAACAELKIDACPMEGFDQEQFNKILGLEEQGLSASVLATIGYRSKDDQSQFATKVRRPEAQLFQTI